jgi:ABC-2 type transport system permease protein
VTVFTGTRRLVLLALRRDRVLLPVWLASISGLTAAVVASLTALYATADERAAAAAFGAASTVARIMDGPASGTKLGAMVMVEAYVVVAILVALMNMQAVVRHTRQDEETGRAELIRSTVVGRHAPLTAALIVAVGANVALAAVVSAVLTAQGLGLVGSIAGGAAVGAVGTSFAGIAAVTAQLSGTQRGANGLAAAALGAAFLLRAVGDALGDVAPSGVELISTWPSWLSPIGWGQQVRPFHQNNWDIFGLFGALFVVLVVVAFVLTNHRDVGTGLMPGRPGPSEAASGLRSPWGLAWRLQRGVLFAWAIGLVAVGAVFGVVGDSADEVAGVSEQLEAMLLQLAAGASLVDLYFGLVMGFLGVAVAAYTVQTLLRMRTEEAAGRLEPVLATAVGRGRWLASHAGIALAGTSVLLAITGLSGTVGYALVTGDLATGLGFLSGALVQAPAALALGGFVIAIFALLPQWVAAVSWAALAASLVMGQLGAILELPQPVLNVSPFTHLPPVPAEPFAIIPVAVLLAVAALLFGLGLVAFRRRDLAITA